MTERTPNSDPVDLTKSIPSAADVTARPSGPPRATVGGAVVRFAPGVMLAERYRIVGRLGRGGMGEVYRADDIRLGESVALKFLPPEAAGDEKWMRRLHDEVRIARQVTHANVCRVYDIGQHDGEPFISMEYVDGEDLSSLLTRIGRLPEDKALQIARQLCAGLAAAHDRGVLHRDLKPANVMLDGRGNVRITDFGIAAIADDVRPEEVRTGTPAYMAPEQLAGREVTIRSDLFALGLLLHEIFSGRPVIEAETMADIRRLHETGLSSTSLHEVDPAVERIVEQCLQPDPAHRPRSALAVAAALPGADPLAAALAAGETPSPELVAAAGDSKRLSFGAAAGLVGGLAALVLVVIWFRADISMYSRVPLDKPPAALIDRAQLLLEELGYTDPPADTAFGHSINRPYLNWLRATDPDGWRERLADPRPPAMTFWYRQSPRAFPTKAGWPAEPMVRASDPPRVVSGEAIVSMDLAGNLSRFFVVPGERIDRPPATDEEPDWSAIFERADLDLARFEATEPRWIGPHRADVRRAWKGPLPDHPEIEVQVEAGSIAGRAAYFFMLNPWEDPETRAAVTPTLTSRGRAERLATQIAGVTSIVIGMLVMFTAAGLALRSQRSGGDRRGATRLALFVFACMLVSGLLSGHRAGPNATNELLVVLSTSVFIAIFAWFGYITSELHVRRRWPTMLVAWTRLLSGQWRDPLVGRSVLVGMLVGAVGTVGYVLVIRLNQLDLGGEPGALPSWGNFAAAQAPRHEIRNILAAVSLPILVAFIMMLILVFLRTRLRPWPAAIAFLVVIPLVYFDARMIRPFPYTIPVSLAWSALFLWLFLRFGLLSVVACLSTDMILSATPLTPDVGSWFGHATVIAVVVLSGVALLAFHAATAEGAPPRLSPSS